MAKWLRVIAVFAESTCCVSKTMLGGSQHPVMPIPAAPMPTSSYCAYIHACGAHT